MQEKERTNESDSKGRNMTSESSNIVRSFHFDTRDKDLAVISEDPTSKQRQIVARIVCLLKDARNNSFLGVQCYFPCLPNEMKHLAQKYNLEKDEWVMDYKVDFIEMKTVLGRQHVFLCTIDGLDRRRQEIKTDTLSGVTFSSGNDIKFCRFVLKDDDLIPAVPA
jgi:hypothetical protein